MEVTLKQNKDWRYAYVDRNAVLSEDAHIVKYCKDFTVGQSLDCLAFDSNSNCIKDVSCEESLVAVCEVPYFSIELTESANYENNDQQCREKEGRLLSRAFMVPFYRRLFTIRYFKVMVLKLVFCHAF